MGLEAHLKRLNRWLVLVFALGLALVVTGPAIYLATGAWLKSLVLFLSGIALAMLAISFRSKTEDGAIAWFILCLFFGALAILTFLSGIFAGIYNLIFRRGILSEGEVIFFMGCLVVAAYMEPILIRLPRSIFRQRPSD